jgi:peptide subunit release factor RF-3
MKWFLIIWIATMEWPVGESRWMDGIVTESEVECRQYIDTVNEREHIVGSARELEAVVLDVDCMPDWWFEHHQPSVIQLRPGHTT